VFTYAPDETTAGIEDFLAQVVLPDDEKAAFFRRAEMQRWFRTLAEEYAADGTLRVHRLDAGGLPAAMTVSLVTRWVTVGALQLVVRSDPRRALAPGVVLVWELIALAADEGCHRLRPAARRRGVQVPLRCGRPSRAHAHAPERASRTSAP
jgi:hypothetical protein